MANSVFMLDFQSNHVDSLPEGVVRLSSIIENQINKKIYLIFTYWFETPL